MISDLTNHLWQSTLFAAAAAFVVAALRQNRAGVRHAVWLAASWKFLLPFSLLMSLGSQLAPARVQEIAPPELPAVSIAIDQLAQPFSGVFEPTVVSAPPVTTNWMPTAIAAVWAIGFVAIALMRLRDWRRIRAAVRASTQFAIPEVLAGAARDARIQVRSSPGLLEPGVVGLWRPILLVPADIPRHLTIPQLEGILAHEVWHVRRRDNLTATIHMAVEALFWFHPLVWWIGARLVEERERACDEYVLDAFGQPHAYAQGILNVCKLYVESPIACVAGVSGSNLKRRIEAIMINRIGRNLNRVRKAGLAGAAAAALAIPFAAGMITAPLRASFQTPTSAEATVAKQRFEVVSVKPCKDEPPAPTGARQGGPGISNASPGRINIPCATVETLINTAYIRFGQPLLNDSGNGVGDYKRIAGGPSWTRSEKFAIEARAEGTPDAKIMLGPMLQTLLEDRFQLKVHREVEERPMYAMTVAKGGLKLKPIGPDGCKAVDRTGVQAFDRDPKAHVAAMLAGEMPMCGSMTMTSDAGLRTWIIGGTTLEHFSNTLSGAMDRRVLDKTGVTDQFNIRIGFVPDEHTPAPVARPPIDTPVGPGPTIFEALDQQLGLKLEPTKGSAGYLVIDRVERPSPDRAPTAQSSGAPGQPALQAAGSPKFEVASIKPCEPQPVPPGGRSGGGNGSFSPGRAYLSCFVVRNLIDMAYVHQRGRGDQDDPLLNWPRPMAAGAAGEPQRIRGGPGWVYADKYTIEAKADGLDPSQQQSADRLLMTGAMLRALLEDRFQLKLHQEVEEVPMFALKVARGGLKIKPMEPGACTNDRSNGPILLSDAARRGVKPTCGTVNGGPNGPNWRVEHGGQTLSVVATILSGTLGIKVVDKTGVTDIFNMTWEFGPDESTPGVARFFEMTGTAPAAGPPTAPSVFRALQEQLGLTVEPIKGPRGYLVIDHIEKPTPDAPSADRPARARGAGR